MRVLVTGAAGFLGSRVCTRLAERGDEVHGLVRPGRPRPGLPVQSWLESGDPHRLTREVVALAPDAVVHLAARQGPVDGPGEIEELVRSNLSLGLHILEGLGAAGGGAFVNAGSFWEAPRGEDDAPVDLYAASKRAFRALLRYHEAARGIRALTLRLFGTYGPGDTRGKFLDRLVASLDSPAPLEASPGEQRLDLLHVDDAARGFLAALDVLARGEARPGEVLDLGSGRARSLRELAALLGRVAGRAPRVQWGARPYREREVMEAEADLEETRSRLGWAPRVDLERGLAEMLEDAS